MTLKVMSREFPAGTEKYEWLKDYLRSRLENPKACRCFTITFTTGSMRGISPGLAPHEFRVEWKQKEGALYLLNKRKGLNDDRRDKAQHWDDLMRMLLAVNAAGRWGEIDWMNVDKAFEEFRVI